MRRNDMKLRSILAAVAATTLLAGCGPTDAPTTGSPTTGTTAAASASPTAAAAAVKDLTPGNCTIYPKAQAVTLLGGVNLNNTALDIGTDGGTKIDVCSYINLKGQADLQGVSYAVVRYDSPATAFAQVQKVRGEMLETASDQDWAVQPLTTALPGMGQVLGGYGTKTESGLTYTIAVVGTNVGPYLVANLGASTESPDNAKALALALFKSLTAAVA
jgi:hypothetical protein